MPLIQLFVHDIRSTHNVGSLLRTADGLGIDKVYFTGYTPYPQEQNDTRLPHISNKLDKQIHKTALGAEKSVDWQHHENIHELISTLKQEGFKIIALEQNKTSISLLEYEPQEKVALVLGREVEGMDESILKLCDIIVEIPMQGAKESFNVVEAATIAMYHCTYLQKNKK